MTSLSEGSSGAPLEAAPRKSFGNLNARIGDKALLALWWLLLAILAVVWLRLDNRFPSGDAAYHLTRAIETARVLASPSLDWLSRLTAASQAQPPLYYLLTAPLLWLFGPGADPAVLINLLFLALLLASTFGIVRGLDRMRDSTPNGSSARFHWPALAAAALSSLYPLVVAFVRLYSPAVAITALAALAIWMLVASYGRDTSEEIRPLRRRRTAAGFGLSVIAGMLTGVGFWAYVLGPAALVAVQALLVPRPMSSPKRRPSRNLLEKVGRRLRLTPSHTNLALMLLISLLAVPIALALGIPLAGGAPAALVSSLRALDDIMGGFLLLLAGAGILYGVAQLVRPAVDGARAAFALVLLWLGSAYLLGALAAATAPVQWLMPLLPAAAVLTALWPAGLAVAGQSQTPAQGKTKRRLVQVLAALTALVAVVNALVITWGAPSQLATILRATPSQGSQPFAADVDAPWLAPGRAIFHQYPPQAGRWQTAAIAQAIDKACGDRKSCQTVVLSCLPAYGQEAFAYYAARSNRAERLGFEPMRDDADFYAALLDADFLVGATGDDGCKAETPEQSALHQQIAAFVRDIVPSPAFQNRFAPLASYGPLPNDATAWILRRTDAPTGALSAADQIDLYRQVLSITPDSTLARQKLSDVLDQVGDPGQALALREEIIARDPDDAEARIALGDMYIANDRQQDAADQYRAALELIKPSAQQQTPVEDLVALYLKLGDAYSALGRWDQAEQAFVRAVENAPRDYDTRVRQGEFYVQRGRFADATAVLQEARTLDPQRPEAFIALANAYLLRDDQDRAAELFQRAREAAPGSPVPVLAWADALAQRGEITAALDLYAQAADVASRLPAGPGKDDVIVDAYLRWIAALQAAGNSQQALTLAQTLGRDFPDSLDARRGVANVYRSAGQNEQAVEQLQAVLNAAPLDLMTRLALGETLVALDRWDEAAEVYQQGLSQPAGHAALHTALGKMHEAQGKMGRAIQAYREALTANPDYYQAAVELGRLYIELDRPNKALETADTALERRPDIAPLLRVRGDANQVLGQPQEALASYRAALELLSTAAVADPERAWEQASLHTRIGALQLKDRNFNAARSSFKEALLIDPTAVDAQVGLGALYLAEALAEAASRASTPEAGALQATDETRYNQSASALQAALAIDPESIAARVALADLNAAYGRPNDAIPYYQEALSQDPAQPEVLKKLFDLYVQLGRTAEVVAFYRQNLDANPDSVQALSALGDALIAAGQPDEALSTYDEYLAQHPDDIGGLMAKADALRTLDQLEDSALTYQRVIRLVPNQPQALIDRADVLASLGKGDEALATYLRAIDLIEHTSEDLAEVGPRGNLYQAYVGLARLLLSQDRVADAAEVTQTILEARPDVAQVHLLAGDLARVQGLREEALTSYRNALALAPANALANTRVGDMLLESGKVGEARDAYEAALGAEPGYLPATLGLARVLSRSTTSVDTRVNSGSALSDADRAGFERARTLLQRVLEQEPTNRSAQLTLGGVLLALDQPQDAASAYQAVLLQDPEDPTAIAGLASALLAAGDVEAAIASYQAAADSAPSAQIRERWLMTLAAAYRSLGRIDEAEQTYRTLLSGAPADVAAVYLALGDLYSAEEQIDEAIDPYQRAAEANPASALAAYRLGRAYLRNGAVDEAAALSEALLQRSPSAAESHLLKARVAQARGDSTTALAGLRQAASLAPTDSAIQTQVGDLYVEAGRPDDAITAYVAAVTLNPRNAAALTGLGRLYGQQGQSREAESALRRALELAPNDLAAQAALGRLLLTTGRPADAIPLLRAAVAQRGDHPTAVQDLADAYLADGRLEEGLAIYRDSLALNPEQEPYVIALALLNAGQGDAALTAYQAIVAERPDDPQALAALGQAYERSGQPADALQSYESAILADPGYEPAQILQGNLLVEQDRLDEAISAFQTVIETLRRTPERVTQQEDATGQSDARTAGLSTPVPLWRAWHGLARAYLLEERLDEALAVAQEAETLRPDALLLPLQVGDVYRAMDRTDEALAAYDRAASIGGSSAAPDTHKGDLYLKVGQLDQAEAAFEAALERSPTDAEALEGLARVYATRGAGASAADFSRAERRFKQAIDLAPSNASAYLALGDLYLAYGRAEDAAVQYRESVKLQPESLDARGRLAEALLAARRPEEALAEQVARQKLAPEDRGVLIDLAGVYRALDRFDEAEAIYRKAIDLAPDDPVLKIPLGDLFLERGMPEQAMPLYDEVMRTSTDPQIQSQALGQLGKASLRLGDMDQALAIADKLIASQPTSDRGYALQGVVFETQGNLDDAIVAYQTGIAQAQDALGLQLALGELYLRQDQPADAQALFETLTSARPNSVDAFVGLAKAHIAQSEDLKALRFEWANSALQKALQLDSRSVPAQAALGDLMMAYERPADAIQAYEAALAYRNSLEEDTALRTRLADAYAASSQWSQALQEYQRVAIVNPTSLGPQMVLGNAYREAARPRQALLQYQRVNRLAPDYPFAYIKQGEILDEQGQADQALRAYQAAAQAAPDSADAWFTLASVYRKRDRTQEAIEALQAGLAIDPGRDGPRRALLELQTGVTAEGGE